MRVIIHRKINVIICFLKHQLGLEIKKNKNYEIFNAIVAVFNYMKAEAVAQWVRASAPQAEGWVFESAIDLNCKNR